MYFSCAHYKNDLPWHLILIKFFDWESIFRKTSASILGLLPCSLAGDAAAAISLSTPASTAELAFPLSFFSSALAGYTCPT